MSSMGTVPATVASTVSVDIRVHMASPRLTRSVTPPDCHLQGRPSAIKLPFARRRTIPVRLPLFSLQVTAGPSDHIRSPFSGASQFAATVSVNRNTSGQLPLSITSKQEGVRVQVRFERAFPHLNTHETCFSPLFRCRLSSRSTCQSPKA
jgi:hypothetical protein